MERVEDEVAFGLENRGWPPAVDAARVPAAIAEAGLAGLGRRRSHRLSGGQQQRLALAGVLAASPGCLVLDEPTANLDPDGAARCSIACARSGRARTTTIVLIEHHVEAAWPLADLVLALDRRRVGDRRRSARPVVRRRDPARADGAARDLAAGGVPMPTRPYARDDVGRRPRWRPRRPEPSDAGRCRSRPVSGFGYERGAPVLRRRRSRGRGRGARSPSSAPMAAASRRSVGCSSACSDRIAAGPARRRRPVPTPGRGARPAGRLRVPGSGVGRSSPTPSPMR